jgi:Zn-dependent protease with chaperone function
MEIRARLYEQNSAESQLVSIHVNGGELIAGNDRRFPVDDLQLQIGGQNDDKIKLLSMSTGAMLVCEDPRLLDDLAKSSDLGSIRTEAERARKKLHSRPAANRRYWATVLLAVVAICVGGYFTMEAAADAVADRIDPGIEARIGEMFCRNNELDKPADAAMLERVKKIGAQLVSKLQDKRYKFRFRLLDDDDLNACAYPGGIIVVYSGLASQADDDQLAGVLGHEIGHVIHRDAVHQLAHSAGPITCLALLAGSGFSNADTVASALSIAQKLESLKFGRSQEANADLVGVRLAMACGYSGDGLVRFFTKLQANPASKDNKLIGMLSTHPLNQERIDAVNAEIRRLKELPTRSRL